ncbi:MAG: hypothetical protein NZ761_06480 [Dehalococcoidia bacterium]|nr:hypothetical protein [Dehalococcoidia bacterium]
MARSQPGTYIGEPYYSALQELGTPIGTTTRVAAEIGTPFLVLPLPEPLPVDEAVALVQSYLGHLFEPATDPVDYAGDPPGMVAQVLNAAALSGIVPRETAERFAARMARWSLLERLCLYARFRLALQLLRSARTRSGDRRPYTLLEALAAAGVIAAEAVPAEE